MNSSASVQTGYAPINGLRIYFEIHGAANPTRPTLMLLHGGGDTIKTSFGHVLPELARNQQISVPHLIDAIRRVTDHRGGLPTA